ncbi:hypothetical protein [Pinisolibacter sp.]|uniref:hypothetical protein n=1 Tax=Pinisolibacter sp. TaxID=2172024 RepID=UPI002FDEFC54
MNFDLGSVMTDYVIRKVSGNPMCSSMSANLRMDCVRFVRGVVAAISLSSVVTCLGVSPSPAQESGVNGNTTYLSFMVSPDRSVVATASAGAGNSPFRYVDGQKAPDAGYARPGDAAREELELAVEQLRRRQTELEDRIEALERRLGASAPAGSDR